MGVKCGSTVFPAAFGQTPKILSKMKTCEELFFTSRLFSLLFLMTTKIDLKVSDLSAFSGIVSTFVIYE